MGDTFYQAMTDLPRHIEEKLLMFNILQLCALVREKPGTTWTGASDQYGPIQEIARRWKLDDLCKRIENMSPEKPLLTYARVMTAIGGNPARETELARKNADLHSMTTRVEPQRVPMQKVVLNDDVVTRGMATCKTMDDLRRVAKDAGIPVDEEQWARVGAMKNFGLSRMWVGNRWRWWMRHLAKEDNHK